MENKLLAHIKKLNNFFFSTDFLIWDQQIESLAKMIISKDEEGKKVLICGNGGSAADAQHLTAELLVKFEKNRKPLRAISLTTDTSVLTACSNDFSFEEIFSRQIEALGTPGDILITFSTSGNSKNIINAVNKGKELKLFTFSFLGKNGGQVKNIVDQSIIVPLEDTYLIQEVHTILYHTLCSYIEDLIK
ncbi:MAG: SIS domain-containing protein [Spirochaetes bacterium]|nr:SIS domain-containing protein [Spirochaetota bacterium]